MKGQFLLGEGRAGPFPLALFFRPYGFGASLVFFGLSLLVGLGLGLAKRNLDPTHLLLYYDRFITVLTAIAGNTI